jgi:hypothetical protein
LNRLLILASAFALLFAVTMGAAALLGYEINDLVVAITTIALATIACVFFLTFAAGIALSIVAFVLAGLIKTRLGNITWLRLLTRTVLYAQYNPPSALLSAIIFTSTVLSVHYVCQISPEIATSPGLAADIVVSAIFWVVADRLEAYSQK